VLVLIGSVAIGATDPVTRALAAILGVGLVINGLVGLTSGILRRQAGQGLPIAVLIIAGASPTVVPSRKTRMLTHAMDLALQTGPRAGRGPRASVVGADPGGHAADDHLGVSPRRDRRLDHVHEDRLDAERRVRRRVYRRRGGGSALAGVHPGAGGELAHLIPRSSRPRRSESASVSGGRPVGWLRSTTTVLGKYQAAPASVLVASYGGMAVEVRRIRR
jgi:hypothetical protein